MAAFVGTVDELLGQRLADQFQQAADSDEDVDVFALVVDAVGLDAEVPIDCCGCVSHGLKVLRFDVLFVFVLAKLVKVF